MAKRLWIVAGTAVFLGGACLYGLTVDLAGGLRTVQKRQARRLEQAFAGVISQAHKAQDGIALQEATQDLARVAGVTYAAVIDNDHRFVAHSRLSEVGKTHMDTQEKDVWSFDLRDPKGRWGTLEFTLSSRDLHALWVHQGLWQAACGTVFLMLFLIGYGVLEKRGRRLLAALGERDARLAEREAEISRLGARVRQTEATAQAWVQSAIGHSSTELLFLDRRQRVIAATPQAARRLGRGQEIIGTSWQECPMLEICSPALEKSLLSPGAEIAFTHPANGTCIRWSTLPDGSGTWVLLNSSNRVVE